MAIRSPRKPRPFEESGSGQTREHDLPNPARKGYRADVVPSSMLTAREWEVVRLRLEGYLLKEIASKLGISTSAVRRRIERASARLGLSSRGITSLLVHVVCSQSADRNMQDR